MFIYFGYTFSEISGYGKEITNHRPAGHGLLESL